jgi:putative glycosyltransferase (TIGR04348 family)
MLIALHARRSHPSIRLFSECYPGKPLIVVLTGTDLYQDIKKDADAQRSLELADRLVVLQRMGPEELPGSARPKARVIYQSSPPYRGNTRRPSTYFRVAVIGHLRWEKDPMRTATAVRELPSTSRIRVLHVGAALTPELEAEAQEEARTNHRYQWAGPLPHWRTRQILAQSHVASISSVMEGSSNVLCEALTSGTPVISSRISGLIGTLGEAYPGYFPVGDTAKLAELLQRAESDLDFYSSLEKACAHVEPLVSVEAEIAAWNALLAEF